MDWPTIGLIAAGGFMLLTNRSKLAALWPKAAKVIDDVTTAAPEHDRSCVIESLHQLHKRAKDAKNEEAVAAAKLLASFAIEAEFSEGS